MLQESGMKMLQAHERARQGRLRFQFMKEIRQTKERSMIKAAEAEAQDESRGRDAAMKIQKVWRGYVTRRKIRKRCLEEMLLIGTPLSFSTLFFITVHSYALSEGMLQPSQEVAESVKRAERIRQERYEKQISFQQLYQSLLVETRDRIRKEKSAIMEENIRSEVRKWVNTYFQQTGKIPDLPSAESGGSRIIFSRQVKLTFVHVRHITL